MMMEKKNKEEQIFDLLQQSNSILICLPQQPSTDAIASGLAMLSIIEKLHKRGRVVSSGFQLPSNHSFLPKSEEIVADVTALKKFIINLDISRTSVEEVAYTIEDKRLRIYVTPKGNGFSAADVSAEEDNYAYDLIISIDAHDFESLGRIYDMNTEFFYRTPVITIDHSPENRHFGQINLVQITATSVSEVIFEMLQSWQSTPHALLDEYIATNLLTGMISKTKSFQAGSVTPRSLAIASHLISQGARREDIVKNLYQSKQLSTLKLWGRALSKLESDQAYKIVWSKLSPEDFLQTGAPESELPDVIDELIINTPEARNVFILYQKADGGIDGVISSAPYINAIELFSWLQPHGSEHFIFFSTANQPMAEVERTILEKLRSASPTV